MLRGLMGILTLILLCACGSQSPAPMAAPAGFRVEALSAPARAGLPMAYKGISYYPRLTPWNLFWTRYDAPAVAGDLDRIRDLGFNSVRIFVLYEQFGGARLKPEMQARLVSFLDAAEARGLKVVVTLFDQARLYAPADYAAAESHLSQLVPALARHRALAAWDLKNESDLDYGSHGAAAVKAWVSSMSQTLRRLDPHHPITASYADAAAMGDEVDSLDYLTFHYYGPEATFGTTVRTLKARFPGRPVVLGEFGFHTWTDRPGDAHPAAHQYNYFNAILATAAKEGLQGILVWTLHDFPANPEVPFLSSAPVNAHLGLLDVDGRPKSGVLALQQSVRVIDADTGTSVTPDTRRLELVLSLARAGRVGLSLQQPGEPARSLSFEGRVGLNSFTAAVSAPELLALLELRSSALVTAPGLDTPQTLIFRRD